MNRIRYYLLAVCFLCLALPLAAQQTDREKELAAQVKQLCKDTASLGKQLRKEHMQLQKVRQDSADACAGMATDKAYLLMRQRQDTLAQLQRQVAEMKARLQQFEDSLRLHKGVADVMQRMALRADSVQGLAEMARQTSDGLTRRVESYIRRPYSQMSVDTLRLLQQETDALQADFAMQMLGARLRKCMELKEKIDQQLAVAERSYDKARVGDAVRQLRGLESYICNGTPDDPKPWTEKQWAEVEQAVAALETYGSLVKAFQSLIAQVETEREGLIEASAHLVEDNVRNFLTSFDEQHAKAVERIPYLKKQYADYRKKTWKNAFHGDKVAAEIKALKTE